MATGAIVAGTTHGGAQADTESMLETIVEAGVAVAEQTSPGTMAFGNLESDLHDGAAVEVFLPVVRLCNE
jgi:hypothetical protein